MNGYRPFDPQYNTAYMQAERRVKEKLGFYWHLASYLVVNGMLIVIYLLTSLGTGDLYYPWFVWPLAGWGVGLVLHFVGIFVFPDTPANHQQLVNRELNLMGAVPPTYATPTPPSTFTGYEPSKAATPPSIFTGYEPSEAERPPELVEHR